MARNLWTNWYTYDQADTEVADYQTHAEMSDAIIKMSKQKNYTTITLTENIYFNDTWQRLAKQLEQLTIYDFFLYSNKLILHCDDAVTARLVLD